MSTIADSLASVNQLFTTALGAVQQQVLALHREAAVAVAKASESAAEIPTPGTFGDVDSLVGQAYDLQVARLEADKQFALELIGAWTPQPAKRPARSGK